MKKLILFILLFVTLKVSAQQTYWTISPPKSQSYNQSIRIDTTAGVPDSLRNHYFSNGNKWNLYYTAAQANARFTGGGGGGGSWGSITGTLSAQTDLNTALNGKLPKTFSANQTITLSGDTLKFGTHGTFISDSTMAAVGNQGFASMLPASFRLGKNLTTWLSITGGSSINTITGNPINITPKVSFTVNPTLGATSTVGYVPTATNTSGDWSWTAPASNSLLKANNLSDVNSVDTSRKNLGFQTIWNRKGTVMYGSTALEEGNVGEPTVIYEGNPQILTADTMVFKMWYGGGFTTPYIFYAESVDGVSWTKYPTAVVSSHNRTFVFKNGSTYYLYAANAANTQLDQYTSSDGVTWTLAHSGVVTSSSLSTSYVFSPFVFVETGTWKMLLDCGIGAVNPGVVEYYLTSTDGVTWVQGATNPVIPTYTVGNPYILKDGGTYWCYGHGIGTVGGSTANTDIYRQSSTDMIHWTAAKLVFPRRSVDEGPSNPLGQVADLSILPVGNSVYLWYVATPDGTTQTGRAHIKLAVANMPLAKLVTTNEGDGGDINPATPAFTYDPSNQNLIITGAGSGSDPALTLNGFTTPYMQFETNSSPSAILGNGISTHLTGPTDFSVIANGSGNISIEAGNLYLNTWGNTTYLPKMAYLGLNSSTSYGYYNYSGGNFFHQYTYNTSHNLYLGNAASVFSAPQNINDVIYASADNQNFSTIAANNQVDAFAQFNKTSKSLILNGGNSAGFTDDANLILNLQSTTKGASFSPMTTTQRTAITSPTESELVYDNTLHNYYFHNGTAWTAMGGGGSSGITALTGDVTASGSGSVAATVAQINGVTKSYYDPTSSIQTQLNGKAATISGTGYSKWSGSTPSFNATIPNADLTNSTISGVALGSNLAALSAGNGLTFSNYTGGGAITAKLDTAIAQTVLNLKPLGSTYWLLKTATTLPSSFTASSLTSFGSSPTLNTAVLTGLPTGTGVSNTSSSSTLAARDANSNLYANAFHPNFTTTVSSATPIVLTVGSTQVQEITGSTAQTVTLPVASTLTTGWTVIITSASSATITVQSSGGNTVATLVNGNTATIWCVLASGTGLASWDRSLGSGSFTGTGGSVVLATAPTLSGATLNGTTTAATIAATLVQGTIQSNTGGLNVSNLYTPAVAGFSAQSGATLIYGGATTTQGRVILGNGSTALTLTGGNSYANALVGQGATITVPNATTSTWITQLAITPLPTITKTGTGSVTNTATAFFSAASTSGTNNYTAYFDVGNVNIQQLTASKAVFTDASKNLTSTGIGTSSQFIMGDGSLLTQSTFNTLTASHSIFTPTTGGTVTLVTKQENIINPVGTLATLTLALPSSPANNDVVYLTFTQAITALTYSGGTVVGSPSSATLGGQWHLTYDSGTTTWY